MGEKIEGINGVAIFVAVCLILMGVVMMYRPHTELIWYLGFGFIITAVNVFINLILFNLLYKTKNDFKVIPTLTD